MAVARPKWKSPEEGTLNMFHRLPTIFTGFCVIPEYTRLIPQIVLNHCLSN